MEGVCTLSFAVGPLSREESVLAVMPVLDGVRLTDLIERFERSHHYEPAGGYAGLVPSHFNFGPLDHYFMGANSSSVFVGNRFCLLGCECGEVGCWPLEAHILLGVQQVTWQDFKQPLRKERDYSAFGPFLFALEQSRKAVIDLASTFRQK